MLYLSTNQIDFNDYSTNSGELAPFKILFTRDYPLHAVTYSSRNSTLIKPITSEYMLPLTYMFAKITERNQKNLRIYLTNNCTAESIFNMTTDTGIEFIDNMHRTDVFIVDDATDIENKIQTLIDDGFEKLDNATNFINLPKKKRRVTVLKKLDFIVIIGKYLLEYVPLTFICLPLLLNMEITEQEQNIFQEYQDSVVNKSIEFSKNISDYFNDKLMNFYQNTKSLNINEAVLKIIDNKAQTTKNSIKCTKDRISELQSKLSTAYEQLQTLRYTLAGMLQAPTDELTVFKNFVQNNKDILSIEVYSSIISVMIRTPLRNYDKTAMLSTLNNHTRDNDKVIRIKELLKAILLDKTADLYLSAKINVDLNRVVVICDRDNSIGILSIPNPHLKRYNCFGTNETIIKEAISNNDLCTLLSVLIATVGNINFTDGIVQGELYGYIDIFQNTKAIKKDGKMISFNEYKEMMNL